MGGPARADSGLIQLPLRRPLSLLSLHHNQRYYGVVSSWDYLGNEGKCYSERGVLFDGSTFDAGDFGHHVLRSGADAFACAANGSRSPTCRSCSFHSTSAASACEWTRHSSRSTSNPSRTFSRLPS